MKTRFSRSLVILALALAALTVSASEPTAFDLVKIGDKFVGAQSKDRVVQIRSDRSIGSLDPNVWYVVYYDPDTLLKAVQVKFAGGQMVSVSRPMRLIEPVTGEDRVLDSDKLKIDSDKALKIALKQPLLKGLDIRSAQYWLQHGDLGPEWRIRLFAAHASNPTRTADIGEVFIAADTGQVRKDTLHPESAD